MQNNVYGLDIHLYSFKLQNDLIHKNDKIRVSITTIPEENKQHFTLDNRKMDKIHHFFTVNITKNTKKIIFVFRKKSFINSDPIIASTIIQSAEFPKSIDDPSSNEIKTFTIFEPLCKIRKESPGSMNSAFSCRNPNGNRTIVGEMNVQFKLTNAFPDQDLNTKNNNKMKVRKSKGYEKLDYNDENIEPNIYYNCNNNA